MEREQILAQIETLVGNGARQHTIFSTLRDANFSHNECVDLMTEAGVEHDYRYARPQRPRTAREQWQYDRLRAELNRMIGLK